MAAEDVFGIVGSVVAGAYQVESVVAEGGFAVVYRAYHGGFRAPVALKCLKVPRQFNADHQREFLEQFRGEAELLFRLSASIQTVVRPLAIDAVITEQGIFMPYMALEWLDGETLEAVAERRRAGGSPFPLEELVQLLTPVAQALARGHEFVGPTGPISIVHRDMKPENIFVAQVAGEQVVKILDFGIGKAKSAATQVAGRASQKPVSVTTSFTPAYGAPEQWLPKRYGQTGPWTDVWGLALSMVETLAGRHIIEGDSAAMMGTAVDPHARPTPRHEGVWVSERVEAVFAKALAIDPRDRYQGAGQFWSELVAAADAMDASTVPPSAVQHAAAAAAAGSGAQASLQRQPGGAAAAPAPAIPDLHVAVPASAGAVSKRLDGPVSLRDMEEFGMSEPEMELALDLPDDDPLSAAQRSVPPTGTLPDSAGSQASPAGAAGSSQQGATAQPSVSHLDEAQPASSALGAASAQTAAGPDAPAEQPAPAPGPSAWESVVEISERLRDLAREMWTEDASLGMRLAPGLILAALALVVTAFDQLYVAATEEVLTLGPVRASWIAGPLLLAGFGLALYRVFMSDR
jgi:serine/threonine-protein kinase